MRWVRLRWTLGDKEEEEETSGVRRVQLKGTSAGSMMILSGGLIANSGKGAPVPGLTEALSDVQERKDPVTDAVEKLGMSKEGVGGDGRKAPWTLSQSSVEINVDRRGFLRGSIGGGMSWDILDEALKCRGGRPRLEELDACELPERWDGCRDVCTPLFISMKEMPSSAMEGSLVGAIAGDGPGNELFDVDDRDSNLDRFDAPAKDHLAKVLVSFLAGLKLVIIGAGTSSATS